MIDKSNSKVKRNLDSGAEEMLHRAQDDAAAHDHRYVYSATPPRQAPGFAVRPNKKGMVRNVSTFYVIVSLICFGASTVAYVNNVIVVNRLAIEINQLQSAYDKLTNTNAVLRSDINRKSGWDRIGKLAGDQVGLRYVKEPPTLFDVDQDLMERAKKVSRPQ